MREEYKIELKKDDSGRWAFYINGERRGSASNKNQARWAAKELVAKIVEAKQR